MHVESAEQEKSATDDVKEIEAKADDQDSGSDVEQIASKSESQTEADNTKAAKKSPKDKKSKKSKNKKKMDASKVEATAKASDDDDYDFDEDDGALLNEEENKNGAQTSKDILEEGREKFKEIIKAEEAEATLLKEQERKHAKAIRESLTRREAELTGNSHSAE